jgi:ribonuclease HI
MRSIMTTTDQEPVIIYTDGACSGNPGPGGWGASLRRGKQYREFKDGEPQTTNNRMELMAAIQALEHLRNAPLLVWLYTDSKYVKDGITVWLPKWKCNGWKTAGKKPVKNEDLWRRLDLVVQRHIVEWFWVGGHAGNEGNERADALAREGMAPFQ